MSGRDFAFCGATTHRQNCSKTCKVTPTGEGCSIKGIRFRANQGLRTIGHCSVARGSVCFRLVYHRLSHRLYHSRNGYGKVCRVYNNQFANWLLKTLGKIYGKQPRYPRTTEDIQRKGLGAGARCFIDIYFYIFSFYYGKGIFARQSAEVANCTKQPCTN